MVSVLGKWGAALPMDGERETIRAGDWRAEAIGSRARRVRTVPMHPMCQVIESGETVSELENKVQHGRACRERDDEPGAPALRRRSGAAAWTHGGARRHLGCAAPELRALYGACHQS